MTVAPLADPPLIDRDAPPERVQRHVRELRDYLHRLVEARVATGERADDLLSWLARDRVDTGELAVDELVGMAVLLLIAGHETTANMIGSSTLLLLRHPARYAALRDDPGHTDGLVDELLRSLSIVRTGPEHSAVAGSPETSAAP